MLSVTNILAYIVNRGRVVPSGHLGQQCRLCSSYRNWGLLSEMVKCVIPPLSLEQHKGDCGRIGIVGGCQEYTGAPYFAAISALKVGADLVHVFCTKDASTVVKSYSPELIVHPILDNEDAPTAVSQWLTRLHALVVGPGLGRSSEVIKNTCNIIEQAKELKLPLVIDADGLFLVTQEPHIIDGYVNAILTPNVVEFDRLFERVMKTPPSKLEPVVNVQNLCRKLGNLTIVQKGENDIISNGFEVVVCCNEGSPRRCGGQGDLLSGSMGTFAYWAHKSIHKVNSQSLDLYGPSICAAYAACNLTRECSRRAYAKKHRSTTTSDMVDCIQDSFELLYA